MHNHASRFQKFGHGGKLLSRASIRPNTGYLLPPTFNRCFFEQFSKCGAVFLVWGAEFGAAALPAPPSPYIKSESLATGLLPLSSVTSWSFHISMFDCFLCKTGH